MPLGFGDAKIQGRPVPDVISHREGLEKDLIATVQQRGTAIIKVRGLSGAASDATGEPRLPEPSRNGASPHSLSARSAPRSGFHCRRVSGTSASLTYRRASNAAFCSRRFLVVIVDAGAAEGQV